MVAKHVNKNHIIAREFPLTLKLFQLCTIMWSIIFWWEPSFNVENKYIVTTLTILARFSYFYDMNILHKARFRNEFGGISTSLNLISEAVFIR